ncbi:hypothetical protein ACFV9G_01445 [Nocardioides sp. NPDC059952]|uniref:hypothetical protein n=1 Tax=Nocardioides sp. NPDC059952 TaxID=3347014 RepID=UPI0036484985
MLYRGWTDDAPGTEIQNGGVAAGPHNYWSDGFDNPEHRIDKIGVLVGIRRLAARLPDREVYVQISAPSQR